MKKHRKKGGKGAAPFDLVTSPTRKQFNRERQAATNLEFGPTQRQLQKEEAGSHAVSAGIPGWFDQYKSQLAQLQGGTQNAYKAADTATQGYLKTAGDQDAAQRSSLDAAAQKDAAARGVNVSPDVSRDAVNASAARQTHSAGLGGTIQGQGANQYAYLADKQRIGEGEKYNQLGKEQGHLQGIYSDQRELAGKKGDFMAKYLSDTRDSERKFYLSNATLAGEKQRAKISARTSRMNSKRSSKTSILNNNNDNATSKFNNKQDNQTSKFNNAQDNKQSNINSKRSNPKKKKKK